MKSFFTYLLLFLPLLGLGQNCTLKATISAPNTAICSGTAAVLTAQASGGTAPYSYAWSTGETTQAITVNKAGTYSVIVTDQSSGCPPQTASVTITSSVQPPPPDITYVVVCTGTPATLTPNPSPGFFNWYDANGKYITSGPSYTTPPINAETAFLVESVVNGCTSPKTTVKVFVYNGPSVTNASTCYGNRATLTAHDYDSYNWFDSNGNQVGTGATFTTPPLTSTTTYYVSANTNGCTTARSQATVVVQSQLQPPNVTPPTPVCIGSSANLHADAPGGHIQWFDVPSGGDPLISSPDFTTPALLATTTYYVQVSNGCTSSRVPVTVTVVPVPGAPSVAAVPPVCSGSGATLKVTSTGATYSWYTQSSGGTPIFNGPVFNTPPLTHSVVYYVAANNGSCESERTAVNVSVTIAPDAPTAQNAIVCPGSVATLVATYPGGTYNWYTAASGGTPVFTGDTFVTPPLNNATVYYVNATTSAGCTSTRTPVTVSIFPPDTPPSASGTTICAGNTATLTASGANNYQWYDAATGGNKLGDAQVFVTPALSATTTYYVQTTGNCTSSRTPVTVTVTPLPSAPSLSGNTTVCQGQTTVLTANASGTVNWYDAPSGGTKLYTGNTFTTPALNQTTTYYADNTSGSCPSQRSAITVKVPNYNPQFQYPFSTVCTGAPNVVPTINNPAGGTFSASPAGLVFVNTATGEVNPSASASGNYTITFASNAPCPIITTAKFTVGPVPDATFSYNGPFCQGSGNPLPVFPPLGTAGVFSASPAGLVFANASTGEIDLAQSAPGTYTVTNTIAPGSTCAVTTYSANVTIKPGVIVNAGPNQQVALGTPVQLAGSINGPVTTGTWSGGAGAFSNASKLNAVYTPGPGETSATLTLTSADPGAPCGPQSASMTVTFVSAPNAPTAAGQSICQGNTATLSATAPGGDYQWYATAAGGSAIATGPNFTTPALTANTTYYVSTIVSGVEGSRTAVLVSVSAPPAPPTANGAKVCLYSPAVLTVSKPVAGYTYYWYGSNNATTAIDTGVTFTTPKNSGTTTYYVAAANGCISTRTPVVVQTSPVPYITSSNTDTVCSNTPLTYLITSDTPTASIIWSRAAVPGISNPAVTAQTSSTITETLVNTTAAPIDVTYNITATNGGCSSQPFSYTVTVNPAPTVTSAASTTSCDSTSTNYAITLDMPTTSITWSRAAVAGISNAAVTGQRAPTIYEQLFNITNAPVDVTYLINYNGGYCPGQFKYVVTVNPAPNITSATKTSACSGVAQNYTITSNVPSATFMWSRTAVSGISNPAVSGQTSAVINETLINTTASPVDVIYTIVGTAFGCQGVPVNDTVRVYPVPATPIANSNSPVCINTSIQLRTANVPGGFYTWTGPDNFISHEQNPDISNLTIAKAGTYTLTVSTNNCASASSTVDVVINPLPVVNAGPDQTVCQTTTSVQLNGSVSGGTTTGIWTSDGTGQFSPSAAALNAQYIPSSTDKENGRVTLTLTSTSKDDCSPMADQMTIAFSAIPGVDAGSQQTVCSQTTLVPLAGKAFIPGATTWKTSGDGAFSNVSDLNASYFPGPKDILAGSTRLTLSVSNPGPCYIDSASTTIIFEPPPTITLAAVQYVLRGNKITLRPTVNYPNVIYQWSPYYNIDNLTIKNPTITGVRDTTYLLTVTDELGCVTTKSVRIIVSPNVVIPNTFTPNGDGINDTWNIAGLIAYEKAEVSIFNRNGTLLVHSIGYGVPWDGTYSGKPVPDGVYYYKIDLKADGKVLAGSITVLR